MKCINKSSEMPIKLPIEYDLLTYFSKYIIQQLFSFFYIASSAFYLVSTYV